MTSISHYNKPIIVLFAFLPLEAAFHKFNTLLLITFDPIGRFRSNFFQTVSNYKGHSPKGFLSLQIVAVVQGKPKKNKILGKWGQKNELVGDLFVKFSKIVLKSFIHNKKLISCHSRLTFFSVVITLLSSFYRLRDCYRVGNWSGRPADWFTGRAEILRPAGQAG